MKIRNSHLIAPLLLSLSALGCSDSQRGVAEIAEQKSQLSKRLEERTLSAWQVEVDAESQLARHVFDGRTAPLLGSYVSAEQAALVFLGDYPELFGVKDPNQELTQRSLRVDELGMTHVRFQQVVKGVPVWGGELSVHFDATGAIRYVANHFVPRAVQANTVPSLDSKNAVDAALRAFQTRHAAFSARHLWREPQAKLQVYAAKGQPAVLVYHVQLYVEATPTFAAANMNYLVEANSAQIVHQFNTLHSLGDEYLAPPTVSGPASAQGASSPARPLRADVEATATGESGKVRKFMVQEDSGSFSMIDNTRPRGKLRTALNSSANTVKSSSKDSGWNTAAVDGHYNVEVTYDYYKQKHSRDSIDGNGMAIISVIAKSGLNDNANWDGTAMNYGVGATIFASGASFARALDIAAHEMTHGVTQAESGLAYSDEAGGLNEGISDIFGCLTEYDATQDSDKAMNVGEDIVKAGAKPMRSMKDPKNAGMITSSNIPQIDQASEMKSNLDAHVSSGVPNSAFFLMTLGGTQPTSKVVVAAGLGWEKAGKVWYRSQTGSVLMSNSKFSDALRANLQAAKDLGFTQNEQNIIECAWAAVGVPANAKCKPIDGGGGGSGGAGGASTGGVGPGGGSSSGGKAGGSSGGSAGSGGKASGGASTGGNGTGGATGGSGGTTGGTGGTTTGGTTNPSGGSAGKATGGSSTGGSGTGGGPNTGGDADCGCKVPGPKDSNGVAVFAAALGAFLFGMRRRNSGKRTQ